MRRFEGIEEMRALVGQRLGTSSWHEVTQERIDGFATATNDHEPLHTDPERAARGPFGVTIAHGLYTLSLGPSFLYEIYELTGFSFPLNYGYDRVRFTAPVRVGSRVRMHADLTAVEPVRGGNKVHVTQTFDIAGEDRPGCVADAVFAYFD